MERITAAEARQQTFDAEPSEDSRLPQVYQEIQEAIRRKKLSITFYCDQGGLTDAEVEELRGKFTVTYKSYSGYEISW